MAIKTKTYGPFFCCRCRWTPRNKGRDIGFKPQRHEIYYGTEFLAAVD